MSVTVSRKEMTDGPQKVKTKPETKNIQEGNRQSTLTYLLKVNTLHTLMKSQATKNVHRKNMFAG